MNAAVTQMSADFPSGGARRVLGCRRALAGSFWGEKRTTSAGRPHGIRIAGRRGDLEGGNGTGAVPAWKEKRGEARAVPGPAAWRPGINTPNPTFACSLADYGLWARIVKEAGVPIIRYALAGSVMRGGDSEPVTMTQLVQVLISTKVSTISMSHG